MIRGINRQMIEITQTDNSYFDRAFLVVRPEYAQAERYKLEREAHRLLRNIDSPSQIKKKGMHKFWLLRMGISALVGAGLASIIYFCFVI